MDEQAILQSLIRTLDLAAGAYGFAGRIARELKMGALRGRIRLLPRAEFEEVLRGLDISDKGIANTGGFIHEGQAYLDLSVSSPRLLLDLVHECYHLLGHGETTAWLATIAFARATHLERFLSGAERGVVSGMQLAQSVGLTAAEGAFLQLMMGQLYNLELILAGLSQDRAMTRLDYFLAGG